MKFYICYADKDRIEAIKLDRALRELHAETCFIDRGDSDLLVDPMEAIMKGIRESSAFVLLHSGNINQSILSQIEVTYAVNQRSRIYMVKVGRVGLSDAIRFELGTCPVIKDKNMQTVATKLIKIESEAERL